MKNVAAWIKTWNDWKCYVKKKHSAIEVSRRQTGGGPQIDSKLSPVESRLIGLIGSVLSLGNQDVLESAVDDEVLQALDLNTSVTSLEIQFEEDFNASIPDQSFCGSETRRKKRKFNNLACEVSEKLITKQGEFNGHQQVIAKAQERRAAAEERRAAAEERRAAAEERKAAAIEKQVALGEIQQRRTKLELMHNKRVHRLKFFNF